MFIVAGRAVNRNLPCIELETEESNRDSGFERVLQMNHTELQM